MAKRVKVLGEIEIRERVSSSSSSSTVSKANPNLHIICSDLLPQILSELERTDLLRFRPVSKSWKICCDRILMERRDVKLVFEFSQKRQGKNTFVLQKRRQNENENEEVDDENSDSDSDSAGIPSEIPENKQVVVKETETDHFSLSRFLSLFSPASFPCVRFGFIGPKFQDSDVLTFFSKYAEQIKQLSLKWAPEIGAVEFPVPEKLTTCRTLIDLLCSNQNQGKKKSLTQLETLEVGGNFPVPDARTDNKKETFENIENSLPSLSILDVETYYDDGETRRIIQTLLSTETQTGAAPNLRTIYLPKNIEPKKILPFFPSKEIQLLKFRGFRADLFSHNFSMEMLQQIDQHCSGLKSLWWMISVPPTSRQMAERALKIVQSLLLKSRESLKSVIVAYAGFIFMMNALALDLGFDPAPAEFLGFSFKNVDYLEFREWDEPLDEVLPLEYFPLRTQVLKSLSLSRTFPCLQTVYLTSLGDNTERYFPFAHNEKLPSVSIFRVTMMDRDMAEQSKLYVIKVLEMFPNLEYLQIWHIFDFLEYSRCFWEMRRLKELDLLIHIGTEVEENSFPNLDVAFTGFSPANIHMILAWNLQAEEESNSIMELRESPCILNLKDLRTFKLGFSDRYGSVDSYDFITRATRDFSFKWMKQVQIEIKITPPEDGRSWDENAFALSSLDNVTVKLGWT